MKEVIGHELVHYVSFAAIDESVFPIRRAIANLVIPMWFVEGLAQYLGEEWHPLKEMVVGDRARENNLMSEGDLGAFYFFDGWGRMAGYYQSDSFVRYIFDTYGKDKISFIFDELRSQPLMKVVGVISVTGETTIYPVPRFLDFNEAVKKVLKKDIEELYKEWREWAIKRYEKNDGRRELPKEKQLLSWGVKASSPLFSPTEEKLAFVSDKDYDFSFFDLYLMDLSTKKVQRLVKGVNPFFSFSPDGKWIVYSKTSFYLPKKSFISDLYKINLRTYKIERLTYGERASEPVFSPDGEKIVFVKKEGGNANLYILELKTEKIFPLTSDNDGLTQNFSPHFSPDGKKVVFVRFSKGKRDLYIMRLEDKTIYPLTEDNADDRCPMFFPDGRRVLFVSNREDNVFNLWSVDIKSGHLIRYTNVKGGVFDPSLSRDGKKVVISGYREGRFSLYVFRVKELESIWKSRPEGKKKQEKFSSRKSGEEIIAEIGFDKKSLEKPEKNFFELKFYPYRPELRLHYIFPWFSVSDGESYFSLDFYASDVLEHHGIGGSFYLSDSVQYDVIYINRSFYPTFFLNFYKREGWSSFQDEVFPVKISGGTGGIQYLLNDEFAVGANYSSREVDTYLFNSSLDLSHWRGKVRKVRVWIQYADLTPVREPEVLPWGKTVYLGAEWAGDEIESELCYLMWDAEFKSYWRISKRKSFAIRLLGKKVENKKPFPRIAFSLGGWDNLRGYKQDLLLGENLLFSSLEYRFNWWRRIGGSSFFYLDSIGGALFYDAGCTWREEENLENVSIREDAGLELRLRMLPFGKYSLLMRTGIAWPVHYEKTKGRFFILFGGVF